MIVRLLLGLGASLLTAAIFWAMGADGRGLAIVLGDMMSEPWTIVTLIDLYLGFFIAAIVIMITERRLFTGLAWALPVFFLGNIWTALWLVIRLPRMRRLLRSASG